MLDTIVSDKANDQLLVMKYPISSVLTIATNLHVKDLASDRLLVIIATSCVLL